MFFFQIYRLVKKKAEILPLATALIARLHSQFDHAFTLLIVMSGRFKSINYYLNRPKIKLSLPKKIAKFSALWLQTFEIAARPPD